MDSHRAGHLGQADQAGLDLVFHLAAHQVAQLIDQDDNIGHPLGPLLRVIAQGADRPARGQLGIVIVDIAHAVAAERPVAALHFECGPLQDRRGLLGIRDYRVQQVRDVIVEGKLDHLGIDHQQTHPVRAEQVQQAGDNHVHADTLAAARGPGHQQVRHPGQVCHPDAAFEVLAQADRQVELAVTVGVGLEYLPGLDLFQHRVGQLHAHRAFAGDRGQNPDPLGVHRHRQVIAQRGDPVDFHSRGRPDFES